MQQTLTEKLLARASGRAYVQPGDIVIVEPDVVLSHDNSAAIAALFAQLPQASLRYPERLAITLDHAAPPPTVKHAENHARIRQFVREQGIRHFFEVGRGICHQVLCEEGLVGPGLVLLGADSHSPHCGWLGAFGAGVGRSEVAALWASGELWLRVPEALRIRLHGELARGVTSKDLALALVGWLGADGAAYQAVEFSGAGCATLSPAARAALCNMMAEMGAKNACMPPDDYTWRWLGAALERTRPQDAAERLDFFREHALYPDADAAYAREVEVKLGDIEPMVSRPHAVDNALALSALGRKTVDCGFIGTCTNGRLEDIAAAAAVLQGQKLRARLLVVPASSIVLQDAVAAGYIATLLAAGASIGTPGCGPCMGNHMGVLAPGERCISSANRNFRGRMGERDASIYLASPAVVAASCVAGAIVHPSELVPGG